MMWKDIIRLHLPHLLFFGNPPGFPGSLELRLKSLPKISLHRTPPLYLLQALIVHQ